MARKLERRSIDAESIDYYNMYIDYEGEYYRENGGDFNVKHGTLFGARGRDTEIALLEEKLSFRFPPEYIEIAVGEGGNRASAHFRSGWWKVLNDEEAIVLWAFTLSLSGDPKADYPHENTLAIEEKFRKAGVAGVPFGNGFRIEKRAMVSTDGWLYFDRADRSLCFAEFDFAKTSPIARDFLGMMEQAQFVGFDA